MSQKGGAQRPTWGGAQRPTWGGQDKIHPSRLVLLGEANVGKTSLAMRFVSRKFDPYQSSTYGAAYQEKTISLDDANIKFEIWDTAGQERYNALIPLYYRKAQAAIVVYDITNQESCFRAEFWIKELQKQAPKNMVIALVGNKADLPNKRMVDYEEAKTYAEENSLIFMETSAKIDKNVDDIFLEIAKKLPIKDNTNGPPHGEVSLLRHPQVRRRAKCCK